MKTKILPFVLPILLLCISQCEKENPIINLNAPYFTITDEAFLNALIDNGVDTNGDSLISHDEAKEIEYLKLGASTIYGCYESIKITSYTGIEAFIGLNTLILVCGEAESLDLSNITSLEYLDCSHNKLRSLDISNCTDLKRLNCSDNWLHKLDVSNNTDLEYIECRENYIHDLDVSNCSKLTELRAWENFLETLEVSQNKLLTELICGHNLITELVVLLYRGL